MSGTTFNRPDFQRLLNDIHNRKVNCLIVKDMSRLARNYAEAGYLLDQEFVEWDVRFISLGLPFVDTYKYPETLNIAVPINNVVNDDFARQTSLKIRKVFDQKRAEGDFIGAFAPYGLKKDPNNKSHLIIDQEAADVVKYIFQLYVSENYSVNAIAMHLNKLGYQSPGEYKRRKGIKLNVATKESVGLWSRSAVHTILHNEMYIGKMVQGKYKSKSYKVHKSIKVDRDQWFVVDNMIEPIIDKKTFESAQELLQRATRVVPKTQELSLFSGFLECGDCKGSMCKNKTKGIVYYRCNNHRNFKICTSKSIRLELLEETVLKTIQAQISTIANLSELMDEVNKSKNTNVKSKKLEMNLIAKEDKLKKLYNVMDELYFDRKTNEISETEYKRLKQRFQDEIDNISITIDNVKKEIETYKKGFSSEDELFKQFLKYKNIKKLDRTILTELVDKIYIYDNKQIEIHLKYQDQYERVLDYIENSKQCEKKQMKKIKERTR